MNIIIIVIISINLKIYKEDYINFYISSSKNAFHRLFAQISKIVKKTNTLF